MSAGRQDWVFKCQQGHRTDYVTDTVPPTWMYCRQCLPFLCADECGEAEARNSDPTHYDDPPRRDFPGRRCIAVQTGIVPSLKSYCTRRRAGTGTIKDMYASDVLDVQIGECLVVDGRRWTVRGIERQAPQGRFIGLVVVEWHPGHRNTELSAQLACVQPPSMPPMEERIANLTAANNEMAVLLAQETGRAELAESRLATLRAKIEALPRCDIPIEYDDGKEHEFHDGRMLNRADVLALFDGERP